MQKFISVFFCYIILSVNGYDLKFNECNKDGWVCRNENGKLDVRYNCTSQFEKKHKVVKWNYKNLPTATDTIIIENCDVELIIDTTSWEIINSNKTSTTERKMNDFNLINLKKIVVANVKELKIVGDLSDLLSKLKGRVVLIFEDIKLIKSLPMGLLDGPPFFIQNMTMDSLNFKISRTNIHRLESDSVKWNWKNIPLNIIFKYVNITEGKQPFRLFGDLLNNFTQIPGAMNSEVIIKKCRFKKISTNFFVIRARNFYFTKNQVEELESYGFNVESKRPKFVENTFQKVQDYGFSYIDWENIDPELVFVANVIDWSGKKTFFFESLHRQDYSVYLQKKNFLIFLDNKFNCTNSGWLNRSTKNESESSESLNLSKQDYRLLLEIEKKIYDHNGNVCSNFNCQRSVTLEKYQSFYLKNNKFAKSCEVLN